MEQQHGAKNGNEAWTQKEGPRGGKYWEDDEGHKLYQQREPGRAWKPRGGAKTADAQGDPQVQPAESESRTDSPAVSRSNASLLRAVAGDNGLKITDAEAALADSRIRSYLKDESVTEQHPDWGAAYHEKAKEYFAQPVRPGRSAVLADSGFPPSASGLVPVRRLGGSTGAELVRDSAGRQFVLKRGGSPGHLRSEFAAEELYRAAGIPMVESKLYEEGGIPVKLAKFLDGARSLGDVRRADPGLYKKVSEEIRKGFVADALFGTWDVVGLDEDNILVDQEGKPWRIDVGGALNYRAQGTEKKPAEWAESQAVPELDSMRDPDRGAGKRMFHAVTDQEVADQIREIQAKRAAILQAAERHSPELRRVLTNRLDGLQRWLNAHSSP
jgi:hypothetical protein